MAEKKKVTTLAGKLLSKEVVTMRDIRLPEFDKNRRINQHTCMVFDNDSCRYDIILGTKFLSKAGIKLDYEDQQMTWFDTTLPLRPIGGLNSKDFDAMIAEGLNRCDQADWAFLADGPNAFQPSADALIRWTPIADELKDLDESIVRNSIHMRWINVRRDIKDTLDATAMVSSMAEEGI